MWQWTRISLARCGSKQYDEANSNEQKKREILNHSQRQIYMQTHKQTKCHLHKRVRIMIVIAWNVNIMRNDFIFLFCVRFDVYHYKYRNDINCNCFVKLFEVDLIDIFRLKSTYFIHIYWNWGWNTMHLFKSKAYLKHEITFHKGRCVIIS